MAKKQCFAVKLAGFPIKLQQQGVDRFTVVYGKQTKKDLAYADAASELGGCIMHALACEGNLDNSERGE